MSENKNNPALGDPYPKVKGIIYQSNIHQRGRESQNVWLG